MTKEKIEELARLIYLWIETRPVHMLVDEDRRMKPMCDLIYYFFVDHDECLLEEAGKVIDAVIRQDCFDIIRFPGLKNELLRLHERIIIELKKTPNDE